MIAICASLLAGIALGHWEDILVAWLKQRVMSRKNNRYVLPNKRYACFSVAAVLVVLCLSGLKIARDIQSIPSYETIAFDEALVSDSTVVPGWVDRLTVEDPEEGLVHAEGWAYDPLSNNQIKRVIVLSDGASVPVSIVWYDRPGVRETVGEQVPIACGFELRAKDVPDTDDIVFYAVLSDGTFLNIPYLESAVSDSN